MFISYVSRSVYSEMVYFLEYIVLRFVILALI